MKPMGHVVLTLGTGAIVGLLVLLAALAGGQARRKGTFGLGGVAWGTLMAWLVLTDCTHTHIGGGRLSDIALPLFFGGIIAWPVAMAWRQPNWFWRWLAAQLIVVLTVVPMYLLAVVSALCNFT